MNGWYAAIKVLKNALCFIMGYLVAMVIRVMLFVLVQFFLYIIYSTGQINVCTDFEINRFRIDEVRKYATIVYFIWRHVTQNGTSYVMGTTTLLIGILTRNILKPTRNLYEFRFKSYGSNSGFRVFSDLDLDLWRMFYFFVTRIAHDVLEYPCEVSLESVQYEWVICCG